MTTDRPEMPRGEAIEMMRRCREEIVSLRATVDRLRPKAEAYESIAAILDLMPRRPEPMGENLVWLIERRIKALSEPSEE